MITFDGHNFNKDIVGGYYHGWVNGVNWLLHRYVWTFYNGAIPDGYHIHHKDKNKDNNDISNLELVNGTEHLRNHTINLIKTGKIKPEYELSLARDKAKEWHKSAEGRKWHSNHAIEIAENMEMVYVVCTVCGKTYKVKKNMVSKSKFCSNKCKSKHRRDIGADNITKKCKICGKEFVSNKYDKRKTCSTECKVKLTNMSKGVI